MPKYDYKCTACNEQFSIRHSISEKITKRPDCESNCSLERIPALSFQKPKVAKPKAGHIVKKHIEEAKKEIELEKEKMKKGYDL